MNILDLISKDTGNFYKKKSNTLGGEWAGICPFCGGKDRFSIHPEKGRFVCRRCIAGDSINFVRKYHNKTYFEACSYLNIQPHIKHNSLNTATESLGQNEFQWKPRKITYPSDLWQEKATAITFEGFKFLMSAQGKKHREYLNLRGITNNTIKIARMGFVVSGSTFLENSWGITPTKNNQSVEEQKINVNMGGKVWIPSGILIPEFKNNKVIRIRIRQEKPANNTGRYIIVKGSATNFFNYQDHLAQTEQKDKYDSDTTTKPWMAVESELCGWLLQQECGDLVNIFAVGSSSARPDTETHKYIKDIPGIVSLDNDEAGRNEEAFWKKHYPKCIFLYPIIGKDPTEDYQSGVDLRRWVGEGLKKLPKENIDSNTKNINTSFKNDIIEKLKKRKQEDNITPNELFNSKIEKKSQKQPEKIQTTDKKINSQIVNSSPDTAKKNVNSVCIHNQYCYNLRNTVCMIDNKDILNNDKKCPKDQWYRYNSKSGIITQIILAPGARIY